ncbi:hypothetical protein NT6N_23130 [Oceaniferula spumae]|uniref:TM2 domain-containing protein n=1 Tax=Oceaniferula spumae TaxID=2979115 RepID=A0AAT9FMU4_9BACT
MSDDQQQPPADAPAPATPPPAQNPAPQGQIPGADKKILAGVLGIVLGGFGVHKFILGYKNEGIIMAAIGGTCFIGNFIPFVGCVTMFGSMGVAIVGLIEGIIYLTKSDQDFVNTYITNKKPWF